MRRTSPGTGVYNYRRFRAASYDFVDVGGPRVGERFPDVALSTIDGAPRRLSDFSGRTVVVETGSVTCPMYASRVEPMRRLAGRHPATEFLVLYVREAHPGHRRGAHCDLADKRAAAASLRTELAERREVLVDDTEGTLHRLLGGLPNMVYVVGPDGLIQFRGDWASPCAVGDALDSTSEVLVERARHLSPPRPSPPVAIRTLLIGGWDALLEFVVQLPRLLRQHRRADRL